MGSVTVHRAQNCIKANKKIEQRLLLSFQTISRLTMTTYTDKMTIKEENRSVYTQITSNLNDFASLK